MRKDTFHDLERVLAAHGVAPRAGGYDSGELRALAAARGWRVEVEAAAGPDGRGRVRAAVWRRAANGRRRALLTVVRRAAATEAAALALALAEALARDAG